MELFVVSDDLESSTPLTKAVRDLGGRPITAHCWLVTADYERVVQQTQRVAIARALIIPSDCWTQTH